jgi:hypothetical protein
VTGDREHLLLLRPVRGIPIITPAVFIELSDAAWSCQPRNHTVRSPDVKKRIGAGST